MAYLEMDRSHFDRFEISQNNIPAGTVTTEGFTLAEQHMVRDSRCTPAPRNIQSRPNKAIEAEFTIVARM